MSFARTLEQFQQAVTDLDTFVEQRYTDPTADRWMMADGLLDVEAYYRAPTRIMWVLKEPHDLAEGSDDSVGGGGWSLAAHLRERTDKKPGEAGAWAWGHTFIPIIYASHGILNASPAYSDVPDPGYKPEISHVFRQIAYLNLKKLPGRVNTPWQVLADHYPRYKDVFLRELEVLAPDVVIGGNTLQFFREDIGLTDLHLIPPPPDGSDYVTHYEKGGCLYIDAYHPSAKVDKAAYYTSIQNAVKRWQARKTPTVSV